jgi:hypothetical protein
MKKVIILLVLVIAVTTSSCSYIEDSLQEALDKSYNEGYDEGYEKGCSDGYDEGYDEGYDIGYSKGEAEPKQVSRPTSGTILQGMEYEESEITVKADTSQDYVVSVRSAGGTPYVVFYVRAGATVTIGVPARKCYVYFASGTDWYGYGEGLMFGKNTHYSMDDELVDFDGSTWTYTLEPVTDGNFTDTPIDKEDFFS